MRPTSLDAQRGADNSDDAAGTEKDALSPNSSSNRGTNIVSATSRPTLKGVVFDMDGTLTKPTIDFAKMYKRCGVSRGSDILAEISQMSPDDAARCNAIIADMEEEARQNMELMPGAVELARWLHHHGIPIALVTRNTSRTVESMMDRWTECGGPAFDCTLSRDSCHDLPPKPHPASLVQIVSQWDVDLKTEGDSVVMVGDSPRHDVVFGKAAGVATALLDISQKDRISGSRSGSDICEDEEAEFKVEGLWQLAALLWKHYDVPGPLGTGKPLKYCGTPTEPSEKACNSAFGGDVTALKALPLKELNRPDSSSNTPLIWAADAGKVGAVRYLLSVPGINVNHRGYLGSTAICRASRRGYSEIVRILALEGGANMEIPNLKLQYPLHFAAFKKMTEAVDALLECGADTMVLDRKGRTPAEDTSDETIREKILAARTRALGPDFRASATGMAS